MARVNVLGSPELARELRHAYDSDLAAALFEQRKGVARLIQGKETVFIRVKELGAAVAMKRVDCDDILNYLTKE